MWAHRSYNASKPLQYILAIAGAGAVEGSIKWWSRGHRAHHRYTDTELDPYNAHRGFWWSHIGWMLVKPRRKPGVADVSDLSKNEVVRWQHRWYLQLIISFGFLVPMFVAGLGWGDWAGGFFYAGAARLTFVHHVSIVVSRTCSPVLTLSQSTFCVNSLAHWLGEAPFDDKHTPRDHVITAFVTIGEGYHNFHHQFPMDYRNAIKWYQYDPTKWFIWACQKVGLASHLKVFPENEVRKGQLTMQLKRLRETQDGLLFAPDVNELPVISWESCENLFRFEIVRVDADSLLQSRNSPPSAHWLLLVASSTTSLRSWTSTPVVVILSRRTLARMRRRRSLVVYMTTQMLRTTYVPPRPFFATGY